MTPRLVGNELMPSAQALNQVVWNTTALIGPALAGLLIQQTSVAWAYGVDVLSAIAMFLAVTRIRPMRPEGVEEAGTRRQAIREGFAYVKRSRLLQSTFVIDIIAMVFGLPRALFTFLAVEQFGHGPEIVGFLFAAPAIGAVLGAASSGWAHHIRRQGDAVVWAVAGWGAAIVVFGLSGDRLWLGLLALALAGWADVISAIFRSTILQTATPDHLRGGYSGYPHPRRDGRATARRSGGRSRGSMDDPDVQRRVRRDRLHRRGVADGARLSGAPAVPGGDFAPREAPD